MIIGCKQSLSLSFPPKFRGEELKTNMHRSVTVSRCCELLVVQVLKMANYRKRADIHREGTGVVNNAKEKGVQGMLSTSLILPYFHPALSNPPSPTTSPHSFTHAMQVHYKKG